MGTARPATLSCGCVAFSEDQAHLIVSYCPPHFVENERRQEAMRERARSRNAERVAYTPEQIARNLERMGAA
jgi:hypothetical protein